MLIGASQPGFHHTPYVFPMCPMSFVVQKALEVVTVTPPGFLNHKGHRAHRRHIGQWKVHHLSTLHSEGF
jgi:hypothetical protein